MIDKHVLGPRRVGRPRRWGITAAGTALVLGVGASGAPAVLADELPQRALQAVTVQLGTDGAITELTSSLISRDDTGTSTSTSTETQALNPADDAAGLPVRVTTSWRHDGDVGTDLADLRGVSGRVEINVTVQNTTVHPERFRYDVGGVAQDSYELVATPMTVVASATLPTGGAGLVRPQPGATEPGTTNGVIDTDGTAATVQWAALLAPPRLSAGTTFTLVQDAEDFRLPEFSVSVQPGLATDTSVARLVGGAFDGPASLVGSENNTIGLIASVNTTLAEVTDSLQAVQQTLSVNAGEVGTAATTALTSTAASVDAATQAVLADLQALDDSVGATVQATNDQALTALQVSVRGVRDYFGTPADLQAPPVAAPPADVTCDSTVAAEEPAPTLLGQLSTVSRQLTLLSSASGSCVADLRAQLQAGIGDATRCADPAATALVCRLLDGGTQLTGLAEDLSDQGLAVLDLLDETAVHAVGLSIEDAVAAVSAVQAAGATVATALDTDVDQDLLTALSDLGLALTAARSKVTADGVAAQVAELADVAELRLAQLTGADPADATDVRDQVAAVAASVCALRAAAGADTAAHDELHVLITGTTCDDPDTQVPVVAPFTEPLATRIEGQVAGWQSVLGSLTDATSGGVATELAALDGDLAGLGTTVTELRDRVTGSGGMSTSLRGQITTLLAGVTDLYDPLAADPACGGAPPVDAPPLNALTASFLAADCDQTELAVRIKALLDQAAADVEAAGSGALQDAAADAAAAGADADASLGALSGSLLQQLGSAADRQVEQGQAVVAAQQAQLAAVQAAAERDLGASAEEAVSRLAAQVGSANQQQAAAAAALQDQLRKVLVDLGSAQDGRGLLGVMQDSAGQTGVRTQQVEEVAQLAAGFQSVRATELADAQLERQQLVRSLQAAQRVEPFAIDLPAGSTSATVFAFRLGGEA